MTKGGVIFDFNGTLYWDAVWQESSWDEYLATHRLVLTPGQKKEYIHGRNGKDTLEILFGRPFTDREALEYMEEKEVIYRAECLRNNPELAPGAVQLLEYLREQEIPMAIATAAGKSNVDFFIDNLHLLDYFEEKNIIYNDGTTRGKPHPDLFEKAIRTLGADKGKSVIFEDSFSGIQAAVNCRVARVIIVNSSGEDYSGFRLPVISHFDEFDRSTLKMCR